MHTREIRNFLILSFGNIIEWYDFSLFSYYSTEMAKVFFPKESNNIGVACIFLLFAVGFIARPLGGVFLGKLGDKFGRRLSVRIAIYGMSISSFLISFIPSYQSFGVCSIVLLTFLRLIQGVSAGGQFSGLMTITSSSTLNKRSFLSSISYSISTLGLLLAISITYCLQQTTINNYYPIWRIAFLISGLLGIIYLFMNINRKENAVRQAKNKINILMLLKTQWQEILGITTLSIFFGSMYFFAYSYVYTMLTNFLDYSILLSCKINIYFLILGIISYPIFGYISDKTNKQLISIIGAIFSIPSFLYLLNASTLLSVLLSGTLIVLCHAAITSGIISITAEVFLEQWKMTASAMSYNLGIVLAGFFPLICQTLLSNNSRNILIYPLFIIILLGLLGHYIIRKCQGYQYIT